MLLALLLATSISIFAQPKITSVTPAAGPLGTTLTITGSNFDPVAANDAVYLGPVKAPITSASTTVLQVKVPTGTAYAPLTVWADNLASFPAAPFVLDWPGGGGFTGSTYLYYKSGYGEQRYSSAMAFGDLDGDGHPDVVLTYAANIGTVAFGPGGITVSRNQGIPDSAAFTMIDTIATGNTPGSIAIQDLDGDGKPDIAVPNTADGTVTLLLNTSSIGHLSFAAPITDTIPGGVSTLLLADFNGDGKPDLIVANGSILVFVNTSTPGHLSFAKPDTLGSAGGGMAIADFDGDGYPDIVTNTGPGLTFYSWPNKVASFATSSTGPYFAVGDLDGDGKPDLAVSGISSGVLSVYHNTTTAIGHPNFTELDLPATAPVPYGQVQIGDLDGDGKPDVAAVGILGITIFKNSSSGGTIGFQPYFDWQGGVDDPVDIYIGDLHGIGQNDVAYLDGVFGGVEVLKYNMPNFPRIASFSPDTAYTGDTVTIKGWYFTGATAVLLGDVPAASYSVTADTLITAVVGTGATGEVTVTTALGSDSLGGFVFVKPPPPPFRLVSFTGTLLDGQALLQWQVTGAAGISSYIIGQSTDTTQFNPIGTIEATGADSANYSFTDTATRQGTNYYRLEMIDTAANITYSNSISIVWPVIPTIFNVYPNPAHNFLTLTLPPNSPPSTVRIVDMTGAVVQQVAVAAGTTEVNFDLTQMTTGLYLLEWSSATGRRTKLILVFK
jgi:hypothetical protein